MSDLRKKVEQLNLGQILMSVHWIVNMFQTKKITCTKSTTKLICCSFLAIETLQQWCRQLLTKIWRGKLILTMFTIHFIPFLCFYAYKQVLLANYNALFNPNYWDLHIFGKKFMTYICHDAQENVVKLSCAYDIHICHAFLKREKYFLTLIN